MRILQDPEREVIMGTRTWHVDENDEDGEEVVGVMESVVDYLDSAKLPITVTIESGETDKACAIALLSKAASILELSDEDRATIADIAERAAGMKA
jgi:hypothetical protein